MVTEKVMDTLKELYGVLDKFINLVGLRYDSDEDIYVCDNRDQVDEEWCDDEMLASIENAHADIRFFLGK